MDGDPTTAEVLVVAPSNLGSLPTSMPAGYEIKDYAGEVKTSKGKIITKSSTTSGNQFYVLSLADYDTSTYNFDNARYKKIGEWYVPTKDQWSAFLTNLESQNLTTTNYSSTFGLKIWYWSSSQHPDNLAWYVRFDNVSVTAGIVDNAFSVRLCATF